MNEKTRAAAIKIMNTLKELELPPEEISEALGLAWCGTQNATYKVYEKAVTEDNKIEDMTWEKFLRLSLNCLKLRCEHMRAEVEVKNVQ